MFEEVKVLLPWSSRVVNNKYLKQKEFIQQLGQSSWILELAGIDTLNIINIIWTLIPLIPLTMFPDSLIPILFSSNHMICLYMWCKCDTCYNFAISNRAWGCCAKVPSDPEADQPGEAVLGQAEERRCPQLCGKYLRRFQSFFCSFIERHFHWCS